ncbi:MAG: CGNR zinc finger domain-containing protein [Acidimicrobiales bacterium]
MEAPVAIDAVVNRWIRRYQIGLRANGGQLEISATSDRPGAGLALAVIAAMQEGTFARLKACPDCRWAFYDHSRNNSKRWCVMNASDPAGRSCGNLAKAHRYRSRHRGARSEP